MWAAKSGENEFHAIVIDVRSSFPRLKTLLTLLALAVDWQDELASLPLTTERQDPFEFDFEGQTLRKTSQTG